MGGNDAAHNFVINLKYTNFSALRHFHSSDQPLEIVLAIANISTEVMSPSLFTSQALV